MFHWHVQLIIFFIATVSFVYLFLTQKNKQNLFQFEEDIKKESNNRKLDESSQFLHIFKPVFRYFIPIIEKFKLTRYRKFIERYSMYAGLEYEYTTSEFIGFQLFFMFLLTIIAYLFLKNTYASIVAGLFGLYFPILWLQSKKKKRQEEIQSSMPDIIDTLSLSMDAGLDLYGALIEVCRIYGKNPFSQELNLMKKNINYGWSWHKALKKLAERVDISELYSFTATLIQAGMGANIADVLKSQAVRMRQDRFLRAEKEGAKATQKLYTPMMLCIFPLVFMIILGPYFIHFITTGKLPFIF